MNLLYISSLGRTYFAPSTAITSNLSNFGVKLRVETVEELKETVKGHLRKMPYVRNILVLVAIEPRGSYAEEE
jgi:hypothetical protein